MDIQPHAFTATEFTFETDRFLVCVKLTSPDGEAPLQPVSFEVSFRPNPALSSSNSPSPPPSDQEQEAVTAIAALTELRATSLHDRLVEMLCLLGKFQGYGIRADRRFSRHSPYRLDAVWWRGDEPVLAAEVQVDGSLEKALNALDHAFQLGCRRVLLVCAQGHRRRLAELLRHHGLRPHLLIWSVSDLWQLHTAAQAFFSLQRRLNSPANRSGALK